MAEKKRFEKIITHPVKKEKRTIGQAMIDTFFPGSVSDIVSYILYDTVIPKVKKAIPIIGRDVLEMLMSPDTKHSRSTYRDKGTTRVSYDRYSREEDYGRPRRTVKRAKVFESPIFVTRREAEDVLEMMLETVDKFGVVTVLDLYEMLGEDSDNISDDRYGWTDLRRAEIRPYSGDFLLDLPRPRFID